jgi:hypothetical protein
VDQNRTENVRQHGGTARAQHGRNDKVPIRTSQGAGASAASNKDNEGKQESPADPKIAGPTNHSEDSENKRCARNMIGIYLLGMITKLPREVRESEFITQLVSKSVFNSQIAIAELQ